MDWQDSAFNQSLSQYGVSGILVDSSLPTVEASPYLLKIRQAINMI